MFDDGSSPPPARASEIPVVGSRVMSQLLRIIFAQECTSTHHKLAIDSLRFLELADADNWRNLFLYYFDSYQIGRAHV